MILLILDGTKVMTRNHMPFDEVYGFGKDETKESLEEKGCVFVDVLPEPENNGKDAEMHYTKEKGVYYEYYERVENETEKLIRENETLKQSVADLWETVLLGGAM